MLPTKYMYVLDPGHLQLLPISACILTKIKETRHVRVQGFPTKAAYQSPKPSTPTIGKLFHVSKLAAPARWFMNGLFDLLRSATSSLWSPLLTRLGKKYVGSLTFFHTTMGSLSLSHPSQLSCGGRFLSLWGRGYMPLLGFLCPKIPDRYSPM